MPQAPRRIVIIHNPKAGWRSAGFFRRVIDRLEERGAKLELCRTEARGDAERIAAGHDFSGHDVVAVAGGDGTINEVANGLAQRSDPLSAPPLAVIPIGTANVLAHEIGLVRRATDVGDYLVTGEGRTIRAGRVNGRVFLLMVSAGFDAWVVDTVDPAVKRYLSKGAYVLQTLKGAFAWRPQSLDVEVDGERLAATTVVAMNGRHYGGPHVMAPDASLFDSDVHVLGMRRHGIGVVARCAIDLALGRMERNPDVFNQTARTIRVTGGEGPIQADGDIVDALPATIEAGALELNLLFPAEPE